MTDFDLLDFILFCIPLSLLAFGGGHSIIAGLQYEAVEVNAWLSAQQFADLFAIARTAPGPTTQIASLIGWQIAGFWGAVAASLAIFAPSSLVTCIAARYWESRKSSNWTIAIEQGLQPVALGLMLSGVVAVARIADLGVREVATVAIVMLVLYFTKVGPYPILGAVALIYALLGFAGL